MTDTDGRSHDPGSAAPVGDAAAHYADWVAELRLHGTRINPKKIIRMTRLRDGRIAWLEIGSKTAGLAHILEPAKVDNFERLGTPRERIVDLVFTVIERGRLIGYHGADRPVYEIVIDGSTRRVAVDVSKNGFIVGAHPVGLRRKVRPNRDRRNFREL
ncbi:MULTISPECIES: hypothetical protein [Actinoalloteichus]|uniref:Uncharacterized protein n=1 Tax=Actinoalloteichus fjordicus TaxID=1612552 RepID=A0AAC9LG77_9PSEU|nr:MULTISPECIES: hypothetical protein [Actinoalloteichus]APU17263.1 hypothetical protein UA74_26290 [Actinoalloteichus fjordicus]APU23346.1 hypothetical protein UA75_26875 [Actinoalloteichus sp. GBA129-24]